MKTYSLVMLLILLFSTLVFSQIDETRHKNRISQLEKLKLVEELELNENTAIRFFARRKEHQKELEALEFKSKKLFEQLDKSIKFRKADSEKEQQKLINDMFDIRDKIEQKKKEFVFSLNDILTTEQVSKYVLFEKNFREEIRKILLERRKPSR